VPTYRLPDDAIAALKKRMLLHTLPMLAVPLSIIFFLPLPEKLPPLELLVVPVTLGLGMGAFSVWRTFSRAIEGLKSYELTLHDDRVIRRQKYLPDITLARSEVKSIREGRDNSLAICGREFSNVILIPAGIEGREQLRLLLSAWQAIEKPRTFLSGFWLNIFTMVIVVALGVTTFVSSNALIVVPAALLLAVIMIWSFREIRKSPNLDSRVKRSSWFVPLVLVALVARVLLVLDLFP